ncbi:MAG: hypothetical protein A2X86_15625 [Bdellovibrionales bacterium GWA2_49_15]|nr:MAG: hypothetical protein A2X86_15625 [Bdellovibrionales bacterium GWA2_49_15]HAZ14560.1 hypothetical protein [Bdellovibrionales bacterium]
MKTKIIVSIIIALINFAPALSASFDAPTRDDGRWYYVLNNSLPSEAHHQRHQEIFGRDITGYNHMVLKAIDQVQGTALDGGGYFMGRDATPPESPIGHILQLFEKPLLSPPRKASYCTGATYAAFVETLNIIIPASERAALSEDRFEALRMQELDGTRREDHVKFWGRWNADNTGHSDALIQYTGMGKVMPPNSARPGDFVNIIWKNNHGHAVIFLGWQIDAKGEKNMLYWSSQPATNGLGDSQTRLSNTKSVTFVRLTDPRKIFSFDVDTSVDN